MSTDTPRTPRSAGFDRDPVMLAEALAPGDPAAIQAVGYSRERYDGAVDDIVARLRSLADDIDARGRMRPVAVRSLPQSRRAYAESAGRVVSEVTNGLAGLNLSGLITVAAEADAYRSAVMDVVGDGPWEHVDAGGVVARGRGNG